MLKSLATIVAVLASIVLPSLAQAQAQAQVQSRPVAPIEVMVLATYHMDNPGQDLHNARIDPVTTPGKQVELARVAEALARFRPTAVAVERLATDPATLLDHVYPDFTSADLLTSGDERLQIAYRLAHRQGLSRVYAIDEQDRPGQPPYFPFGPVSDWASAHGRETAMAELNAQAGTIVGEIEQRQRTRSVGRVLAWLNDPAEIAEGQGFYARIMAFGANDAWPGAVLNGRWYTRNAVIFARLMQVARPGDRIVVVYGAGHAYWLRQMVSTTPGYRLVEPNRYLRGT